MKQRRKIDHNTAIPENKLNQPGSKLDHPVGGTGELDLTHHDRERAVICGPALSSVTPEEREIVSEIVDALHSTGIRELPEEPRGDTIRSLLWALEALLAPLIESQEQHCVPFNASLTREEVEAGKAIVDEVWNVCCGLLHGLSYLTTRGQLNRTGAEIPATWSPGDFCCVVDETRPRLERLGVLSDNLCRLRDGEFPQKSAVASGAEKVTEPKSAATDSQDPTSNN